MSVNFGDAQPFESLAIISAVQDVPLFAALEDFFFLRGDLRADFGINLFFELQQRRKNVDDFLANGVAVFDEIYFGTGDEKINNAM